MRVLLLDFEAQSLDAATTNPTEVGALLVEKDGRVWKEKLAYSQLIYESSYPPQTDEIVDITGITDEILRNDGARPKLVFETHLNPMLRSADLVVAHNAAYDRGVYEATCRRLGLEAVVPGNGWLCTVQDVPWPKKYKCKKLSHLAYEHGILVDPATLHRALDDVRLLGMLLARIDLSAALKYRDTPWIVLFLNGVKPPWEDGGISNGQAKKLGYSWETPWGTDLKFPKRWVKLVKEDQTEAEKARTPAPFFLTRQPPAKVPVPETPTV